MEKYPKINTLSSDNQKETLLIVKSLTYNVEFSFLPYNIKITENLSPEWNEQTVIGRMDPVSNFKRMGRTMTVSFQARAKNNVNNAPAHLNKNELIHTVDHLKRCLYPRYDVNQVMVTPPLFRFRYGNLIAAGEDTFGRGALGYITSFSANPNMEINKIFVDTTNNQVPFFPKVFDINFTFTVLNESLGDPQKQTNTDILKQRFFYNYNTDYHHQGEPVVAAPDDSGNGTVEEHGQDKQKDAAQAQALK